MDEVFHALPKRSTSVPALTLSEMCLPVDTTYISAVQKSGTSTASPVTVKERSKSGKNPIGIDLKSDDTFSPLYNAATSAAIRTDNDATQTARHGHSTRTQTPPAYNQDANVSQTTKDKSPLAVKKPLYTVNVQQKKILTLANDVSEMGSPVDRSHIGSPVDASQMGSNVDRSYMTERPSVTHEIDRVKHHKISTSTIGSNIDPSIMSEPAQVAVKLTKSSKPKSSKSKAEDPTISLLSQSQSYEPEKQSPLVRGKEKARSKTSRYNSYISLMRDQN